jgi:plastocyanin
MRLPLHRLARLAIASPASGTEFAPARTGRRHHLRLAAALAVAAAGLAGCGAAAGVAPPPSESLQAGMYGGGTIPPATASVSPSSTTSASPTAAATAAPGGPCNACGTLVTGVTAAATVDATDQDVFAPATVTVKVGDVVEWKDTGLQSHTVTFSGDSAISDSLMKSGQTWEIRFTRAGSFRYECLIHLALGMVGTVVVSSS